MRSPLWLDRVVRMRRPTGPADGTTDMIVVRGSVKWRKF